MSRVQYKVLILCQGVLSELGQYIQNFFDADMLSDLSEIQDYLLDNDFKVLVLDCLSESRLNIELCQNILASSQVQSKPVIMLSDGEVLEDKLRAYDIGCDDFIDGSVSGDEACARVTKSIFHRIATDQLATRLAQANEAAHTAMVDNSDLGANIQFLLAVHNCDNLDQLGQQFFSAIERYGLRCSLQIRCAMGVKNMEAHGMAKDLESQLLAQLSESGRYIDFGSRTILNYGHISLLIKNMPKEDPEKYGALKDNTFSLVQGLNARVLSLEDQFRLVEEKESLKRLSKDVSSVVNAIKSSYQDVMQKIVSEVEQCSELLVNRVPHLALTEKDEKFLEGIADRIIKETNATFSEGLLLDETLNHLEAKVKRALVSFEAAEKVANLAAEQATNTNKGVELF